MNSADLAQYAPPTLCADMPVPSSATSRVSRGPQYALVIRLPHFIFINLSISHPFLFLPVRAIHFIPSGIVASSATGHGSQRDVDVSACQVIDEVHGAEDRKV